MTSFKNIKDVFFSVLLQLTELISKLINSSKRAKLSALVGDNEPNSATYCYKKKYMCIKNVLLKPSCRKHQRPGRDFINILSDYSQSKMFIRYSQSRIYSSPTNLHKSCVCKNNTATYLKFEEQLLGL